MEMGTKSAILLLTFCFVLCSLIQETEGQWRGRTVRYWRLRYTTCWRCICRYWWGCSVWRRFTCSQWYWDYRCEPGWTHNGNLNCDIPICRPRCDNGGTCINPNQCDCPPGTTGAFCQTLTCAFQRPCYPGNCYDNNKCNCTEGFDKDRGEYGCLIMEESEKPVIGRSTSIIEFVRQTDQRQLYYFLLDGTDENLAAPVWSNQDRFNLLSFEFEARYEQPEEIPARPIYVHSMEIGIVRGTVDVEARFFNGSLKQPYSVNCTGVNQLNPEEEVFNCTISDLRYITLTEHGESLTCRFTAYSGGYRRMTNDGSFGPYEYFTQVSHTKTVQFRFDFIAPKHCSEKDPYSVCTSESTPLTVEEEFTKGAVNVRWHGWADESYGAGLWIYYFEVHKLINKNPATGLLTEVNPINPAQSFNVTADNDSAVITIDEAGMYSILMETVDIANNSKWCRRFVLFDDSSEITIHTERGKMFYVSSANSGTNYTWQTAIANEPTIFDVIWLGHFKNPFHEDNLLLNAVDEFPIQFADIEDDGVLSTTKFIDSALDDFEGERTRNSIPNIHGIVKFEYVPVTTLSEAVPTTGWRELSPLTDRVTFNETLANGAQVRVWVKAHDVMGNTKVDSTVVRIDQTPPQIQNKEDTEFRLNVDNGTHLHTSRIYCDVQDLESGVYEIGIDIVIDIPGEQSETFITSVPANIDYTKDPLTDPACASADPNICFVKEQMIDLDNCWFMIEDREKLDVANASVTITAYNQALLSRSLSYTIDSLTNLSGLAVYSGPVNFRIENVQPTSFRLAWDLPDKESCYGKANVIIIIFSVTGTGNTELDTRVVSSNSLYLDVGGLDPESRYLLSVGSEIQQGKTSPITSLTGVTVAPVEPSGGVPLGAIVGAVVGVLVIVSLVVVVMIFLVRRGYIHPVDRARSVKRRATARIRKTIYGEEALQTRGHSHKTYQYDNRQSELYIYGGDDFDGPQAYHIDRDDITFETLIKSGHFANIYKASYKKNRKSVETVAAKTLREHFSKEDETLMKAKINFTGTVVGEHPNVLKFIGAVVDDPAMGPFILYEYCEHGPLKDYLKSQKSNVTIEMQDNLFRFGLDVARGMEYLAAKNVVHRRLAARNILLTFLNEVKIAGFGPQPLKGEEEDVEQGKKERIPIKWMAPECMKSTAEATEKSDVWSYAVVLWEIFSLGDDPYPNIRARDLPGKIKSGTRLSKPEQCDDTWYGVMTKCWQIKQDKRPSFKEIRDELDSLFTQAGGDEDYYYYKR